MSSSANRGPRTESKPTNHSDSQGKTYYYCLWTHARRLIVRIVTLVNDGYRYLDESKTINVVSAPPMVFDRCDNEVSAIWSYRVISLAFLEQTQCIQ